MAAIRGGPFGDAKFALIAAVNYDQQTLGGIQQTLQTPEGGATQTETVDRPEPPVKTDDL